MAFKSNLSKLFSAYDFETLADDIRRDFAAVAGEAGFNSAVRNAPVGDPPEDKHPGQLRDAIYWKVENSGTRTKAIIAIPTSIPYRFAVIFGDKRHEANGFMEVAKSDAVKEARQHFKKISRDALIEMNNKARGKL